MVRTIITSNHDASDNAAVTAGAADTQALHATAGSLWSEQQGSPVRTAVEHAQDAARTCRHDVRQLYGPVTLDTAVRQSDGTIDRWVDIILLYQQTTS